MDQIIAWAVAAMLVWVPVGRSKISPETPDAARARYAEIATAAAAVAYNPEEPSLFAGPRGRAATMGLLLSVALMESGFRKDVDLGIGPLSRGEGKDSCLVQIRVAGGKTAEGWTHEDLVGDRVKCFTAGLHKMRRSFMSCRKLPQLDWLSAYTRGACTKDEPFSRARMLVASRLQKPPIRDADILPAHPGGHTGASR